MKLKGKLVGLGLIASVFAGFCAFESASYADAKNVKKVSSKSSKFDAAQAETDVESVLKSAEEKFFEFGLDKCEKNPIFYLEATEPVRNKTKNKKLFQDNSLAIHFSPTFLRKKCPAFRDGFKHATFEVIDRNKHVCRFTVSDVFAQPYGDCGLVYVPSRADSELVNKREKKAFGYEKVNLDEDFEVAPGELFTIRVYDSAGNLAVEESGTAFLERDDEGDEAFYSAKSVAHLKDFDKGYWRKVVSEIGLSMKNELDKTVDVVLRALASSKKSDAKGVVDFGEVDDLAEAEDEE